MKTINNTVNSKSNSNNNQVYKPYQYKCNMKDYGIVNGVMTSVNNIREMQTK